MSGHTPWREIRHPLRIRAHPANTIVLPWTTTRELLARLVKRDDAAELVERIEAGHASLFEPTDLERRIILDELNLWGNDAPLEDPLHRLRLALHAAVFPEPGERRDD